MAKQIKLATPPPPPPESEALRNWRTLWAAVGVSTEEELWALLEEEKRGKARRLWMQRIYGRASTLRGKREAKELMHAAKDFNV